MGRWGHRLFEGDQDINIACDLGNTFKDFPLYLGLMIHQSDMLAPEANRQLYKTDEYQVKLAERVARMRAVLDSGLGDRLFVTHRAQENQWEGKYRVILVSALLMRAGAKIKPYDMQHLRDLVPQINCDHSFALPIFDKGFRAPGKAQFLAALDNYTAGTPRNYQEPSCFNCGKVEDDLGFVPMECARCKRAWYCSRDCQRQNMTKHKAICVPLSEAWTLNV